jgi:hypothetical protein
VVVIGRAGARRGITEDHLTVGLRDQSLPRGARAAAVLELDGGALFARTGGR